MDDLIQPILDGKSVSTLFQPIVAIASRTVVGFEALTRGPPDSPLHAPQRLFEAAEEAGKVPALERVCFEKALRTYSAFKLKQSLSVNLTPDTFLEMAGDPTWYVKLINELGIDASRISLEITEQSLRNYTQIRESAEHLRELGFRIVIDDLGSGYSSLRGWSEVRPDYVKIDRYFVSGIDKEPVKSEFLRTIIDLARAIHCRIVAEGVETEGECRELMEIGVDLLQGYYFGRPEQMPRSDITDVPWPDWRYFDEQELQIAESLIVPAEPVGPDVTTAEIMQMMRDEANTDTIAVVENERPIGVVRRSRLFTFMSEKFRSEMYADQPIAEVPAMDNTPLCVDSRLRLDQVSRLVTTDARRKVDDDFIITRDGAFAGFGQTIRLLKQITEQQLTTAKHANPLTLLPGNVPIYDSINRLISRNQQFFACYIDIDHFKPYNDHYGYAKGDEILVYVAGLLTHIASKKLDFVGHVGGDDFIVVFTSGDWRRRLRMMFEEFSETIERFYSRAHQQSRNMPGVDRFGVSRTFSLMTLSAAVVDSQAGQFETAEKVSHVLSALKTEAKHRNGNAVMIRDADGVNEMDDIKAAANAIIEQKNLETGMWPLPRTGFRSAS